MDDLIAYKKEILSVGKWLSDTKIKYRWCLKIKGTLYVICFTNSKVSRMARVNINDKEVYATKKEKNVPFNFQITIDDLSLVIKKHPLNNEYELFVENEDYEYLARCTTRNCEAPLGAIVDGSKILEKDFTVKQTGDCFLLCKSLSTFGDPSEVGELNPPRYRSANYTNSSQNPPSKANLNDSGYIFKTDYIFLNIADINEDKFLVKRVNNF